MFDGNTVMCTHVIKSGTPGSACRPEQTKLSRCSLRVISHILIPQSAIQTESETRKIDKKDI